MLGAQPARPLAAGEFRAQCGEWTAPEVFERTQPFARLLESLRVHRIQSSGARRPDGRESLFPEHPQMLGDCRLGDPELVLDDAGDATRGLFSSDEKLENASPDRIAQNIERVHGSMIARHLI